MGVTFKKQSRETGLMAVGRPYRNVDIKWNGKVVGWIRAPIWSDKKDVWTVYLVILKKNIAEDGNPNCEWRNAKLPYDFDNEEKAREFVKKNLEQYMSIYTLYCVEENLPIAKG